MTLIEAQIQALKDNDLASATFEVSRSTSIRTHHELDYTTARLIAYLLKRVTQAEELIGAIVEANERAA